jgi:heme/copper-type cytochrome/quinol oxidase subunit 3
MALLLKIPALFPTLATLMLSVASITLWIAPVAADSGKREAVQQDLILMQGKWKLVDFVY